MMDRLTLTISAAAVLGIAWAMSRAWQWQAEETGYVDQEQPQQDFYQDDTAQDYQDEPDQTTTIFEDAVIAMTPSTYIPANVTPDQAQANVRAFLDMIAYAEGTAGPNGYRMLFGGRLFDSYADHPRVFVPFRNTTSSAAGRYQMLSRTWETLRRRLSLPDFSPASQDAAAIELIRERGALNDVRAGRLSVAVDKVRRIWASLPGAGYDQPERSFNQLANAYTRAGGAIT